jgi:hypothetical protein
VRIEAHQVHEGLIAEQQEVQGIDALDPEEGLQAIEQDTPDHRHHRALDRRTLDLAQPVTYPQLLQKMEADFSELCV